MDGLCFGLGPRACQAIGALSFLALVAGPACAQSRPAAFVDAAAVVPGLIVEMRYAGTHNFVGTRIDGYEAPVCLLTRQAADALIRVQLTLASSGVGLKVFDCYRPARAVAHFVRWARDVRDVRMKGEFYPEVRKATLFRDGYIASRSGHSRGSTVDLTLAEILPGPDGKLRERDMGTPYDFFSPLSWADSSKISEAAQANRKLLADAMRKGGFLPYRKEWWHFTLANEPFPESYFDFPVR